MMRFKFKPVLLAVSSILLFVIPAWAQITTDSSQFLGKRPYLPTHNTPDMSSSFYKVFLITAILLLIFVTVMYVYKKLSGHPVIHNRTKIFILARQSLGPKQSVMVVAIDQKKYALGVTDHSVQLISELGSLSENEVGSAETKAPPLPFGALLDKIRKK